MSPATIEDALLGYEPRTPLVVNKTLVLKRWRRTGVRIRIATNRGQLTPEENRRADMFAALSRSMFER